jgi:hypothetical protein
MVAFAGAVTAELDPDGTIRQGHYKSSWSASEWRICRNHIPDPNTKAYRSGSHEGQTSSSLQIGPSRSLARTCVQTRHL